MQEHPKTSIIAPFFSRYPFVLQQSHLQVSKTHHEAETFRLSACVLSNTERQNPTDWRRAEQCGGEKEGPGRKMLLLVTRSLLCPHCQILASSPAQLAAWCDLQLFSQQRSAAQLFSGHYKIIPRSDWHGRAVCSQLPDLNICCNDTRGTMKIRDAPHRAEHFFFFKLQFDIHLAQCNPHHSSPF